MKTQDFKVIIVGAGVCGLTCGIRLLEHGFAVTIVARELSPNYRYRAMQDPNERPFAHPYYWAAFTVNGM